MIEHYKNLDLKDIDDEVWADIPEFEGFYQISSLGRVKSLQRNICDSKKRTFTRKEKILKQDIDEISSCSVVRLYHKDSNKIIPIGIAKLVCAVFLGKKPYDNMSVLHKDNNPLNNIWENLYWKSGKKNEKSSNYIGVCLISRDGYYKMSLSVKHYSRTKRIQKYFKTELEAAKKYDYYVKKYKLNRELNFPDE